MCPSKGNIPGIGVIAESYEIDHTYSTLTDNVKAMLRPSQPSGLHVEVL
jgi:hypothetical protein